MKSTDVQTRIMFGKEVNTIPVYGSHTDFIHKKRFEISSLIPNQHTVDINVINQKRRGLNLTMPYVIIKDGHNILIDGHHTVLAKKINKRKFVYAKYIIQ